MLDVAKDAITSGAIGFGFYYWITELNPNIRAAAVTVLILMTILAFVAIRQMDRRSSASDLDTFKDVAVALTVSIITAYALDSYGSLAVAGSVGGALVAIAAFVFLFREDAKKMALKKAGKS